VAASGKTSDCLDEFVELSVLVDICGEGGE
jgi:hypothetical protein